jgi:hypothetical protein
VNIGSLNSAKKSASPMIGLPLQTNLETTIFCNASTQKFEEAGFEPRPNSHRGYTPF